MHDIMFRNQTSLDHHRRDILLSEQFIDHGVMTDTQKHFTYFVREHSVLNSPEKLQGWIEKYARKGPQLKDLSVLKSYDSKTGEEKFEVRIIGNLYVVRDQEIFNVDFTQIFKIDRKGECLKGKK